MTGTPLERLCAHRGVAVPPAGQLLDLAPALGMRPADLLAIAGGEIPAEFMPTEPDLTRPVDSLVGYALRIGELEAARDHARSLARMPGTGGLVGLPALDTVTFGAVFTRLMLLRNLSRTGMARATWSSISTVAMAMGVRVPTPERLAIMAAVLCLRADDVEAMAARPTEGPPPRALVLEWIPRLWATGEVLLELAPLKIEQINAVLRFAGDQLSAHPESTGHWSAP